MKFTVVLVVITLLLGPWSAKLSEQVSTSRLPWLMQRSWSTAVKDVSFLPNVYTYQHMTSKPY
jgi:amino acid transporter